MSIFVHIDCCDYMVLDFRQQLKTALKDVEMAEGSNGRGKLYTPLLLGFNMGSFKKDITTPYFRFQHLL